MKRRTRTYTIKQKQQALALLRQGHTGREVERETGVRCNTALDWARREGIPNRRAEKISRTLHRKTGAQRRQVVFQYDVMQRTMAEAARVAGVTETTAHRWLHEEGLARDRGAAMQVRYHGLRARARIERIKAACEMRAAGLKCKDIAIRFGVSKTTFRAWWNSEHNIYKPDPKAVQDGRRARRGERWAA